MTLPSSTEVDCLRQTEIERRILPLKGMTGVLLWLGLALTGLSHPAGQVLLTTALGAAILPLFFLAGARLRTSRMPLAWLAATDLSLVAVLVYAMTWTGGVHSPVLPMTLLLAIVAGARYPLAWLVPVLALNGAMIVLGMALGGGVGDAPLEALAWAGAYVMAAAFAQTLLRGDREAWREAARDPLTGVLTRTALDERIAEELSVVQRRGITRSVIVIDLDELQALNDDCGYEAGDEVLRAVATTISARVREGDLVYRLGGDEFLVLLPDTPAREAHELAERLRSTVARLRPAGQTVTLSAGVAGVERQPCELHHLISRADRALHAVKEDGRDQVRVAALAGRQPDRLPA